MRLLHSCAAVLVLGACTERREPPGAHAQRGTAELVALGSSEPSGSERGRGSVAAAVGTIDDNAPFEPSSGSKLASIAWRTWVYTDVGPARTRYGYLRAGAVLDARGPAIKNDGCEGGWYRINPRGFVCIGKGATLDLNHPIVTTASARPVRGQGLPYVYALADDNPPFFYFRFPKPDEMKIVEGPSVLDHARAWRQRVKLQTGSDSIGEPSAPPEDLSNARALSKPYGVHERLHYSVHSGRAATDSGFAFGRIFAASERVFGLTTEHDVIALDRTRLVRASDFHGVELDEGEALPVAFVESRWALKYGAAGDGGALQPAGGFRHRQGLKLTGTKRQALLETREGSWVAHEAVRLIEARTSFPSFVTGTRKWIDISINQQSLVAYVGTKPAYATLVSTGRGGLGDAETGFATVRGTFMIHTKHVSATMDGDDDKSDSYNLLDVPFVQYFHKGFALHGTYWHDEFGKIRSHGCINLSPIDAAWLFEWTDPVVPSDWHGVINLERGTVVHIRP
jgi:hypothetical protein